MRAPQARGFVVFGDGAQLAFIMVVMRYVSSTVVLAVLVLVGADARANPPSPPGQASPGAVEAPRAAVMGIMKEAGQALLWDANRGEYVVVRVGARFHQYRVTAIAAEHVVLTEQGGNQHFVLPRTSDTSDIKGHQGKRAAARAGAAAAPAGKKTGKEAGEEAGELIDPYGPYGPHGPHGPAGASGAPPVTRGSAPAGELTVLDPYATTGPFITSPATTAIAPPGSRASEPKPEPQPQPASADPAPGPAQTPQAPQTPGEAIQGTTRQERHTVSRREFDAAVTDFHRLSKEIQLALVDQGVHIQDVARGSLFYRWGFRAGDVVQSVDGQPIRGVDDAAAIYARLMDAEEFAVKVKRGAGTVIFRYRFSK